MKKLTLIIIGALALASCRKQPNLNELSYNPIVATPHYDGADWTQYKTYYIPDTIAKVDGDHPMDSVWTDANAQNLLLKLKKI